jgi:hypothetical protein
MLALATSSSCPASSTPRDGAERLAEKDRLRASGERRPVLRGSVATRVESFDGVPLDVNLTLPPAA